MAERRDVIAEVARAHLFTLYPEEIACDCDWVMRGPDSVLLDAWCAHLADAIAAALPDPERAVRDALFAVHAQINAKANTVGEALNLILALAQHTPTPSDVEATDE